MTITLTEEQQSISDYVKNIEGEELVLVNSVAGSGKTSLLKAIASTVGNKPSCYLAYNKAVAMESSKKFSSNVDCRTTHSLAYKAVVVPLKLKVGFFGTKQVKERIPYKDKYFLVEDIKEFCLSKYLTYEEYAEKAGRNNTSLANYYLEQMSKGKIECSHDFYLKMFHIYLSEDLITQDPWELLMLDEAGDLNEVTLEIFKLLPARIKIAVGDPYQNIYTFNHTINCFESLKDQGTEFKLSKSFRVPKGIASSVERFCKKYLDPDMVFEGVDVEDKEVDSVAYISRTNGGLISKIVELNQENTPYGLVRKAQEIFKIPLMVAGLKYQGKIYDPAYRHLQDDVDDWYENKDNVKRSYKTLLGYLKSTYAEDLGLMQSINLVIKYGKSGIFDAYAEAKNHENTKQDLMLMTAHSCKGLEYDEVVIAPDLNNSIADLITDIAIEPNKKLHPYEKEALNLYYVATTRALVSLKNAIYL